MVCTGDYGVAGYTSWKASKGSTAAWSMTEMFVLFKDVPPDMRWGANSCTQHLDTCIVRMVLRVRIPRRRVGGAGYARS